MNDVRVTPVTQYTAPAVQGAGVAQPQIEKSGADKPKPEQSNPVVKAVVEETLNEIEIEDAVAEINNFVQSEYRDLSFSLDEGSGQTVVRVMDRETGDLIRQIPEDVFLRLAKQFKEEEAVQLINVHS